MTDFVIAISSLDDLNNYKDFINDTDNKIIIKNKINSIYSLGFPYIDIMLNSVESKYKQKIDIFIDVNDDAALGAFSIEKGYKSIVFNGNKIVKEKLESIGGKIGNDINIISELVANVEFSEEERKIIFLK